MCVQHVLEGISFLVPNNWQHEVMGENEFLQDFFYFFFFSSQRIFLFHYSSSVENTVFGEFVFLSSRCLQRMWVFKESNHCKSRLCYAGALVARGPRDLPLLALVCSPSRATAAGFSFPPEVLTLSLRAKLCLSEPFCGVCMLCPGPSLPRGSGGESRACGLGPARRRPSPRPSSVWKFEK